MTLVPSVRKFIVFDKPFPENIKKEVYRCVFDKIHELEITSLYEMKYNYSCEGGIELPKTPEWIDYLDRHDQSIHIYQSTRQLRFDCEKDNIIGMRCKDGINIFTEDELDNICFIMNEVIKTFL